MPKNLTLRLDDVLAADVTGLDVETNSYLPNLMLAESALHTPVLSFFEGACLVERVW